MTEREQLAREAADKLFQSSAGTHKIERLIADLPGDDAGRFGWCKAAVEQAIASVYDPVLAEKDRELQEQYKRLNGEHRKFMQEIAEALADDTDPTDEIDLRNSVRELVGRHAEQDRELERLKQQQFAADVQNGKLESRLTHKQKVIDNHSRCISKLEGKINELRQENATLREKLVSCS